MTSDNSVTFWDVVGIGTLHTINKTRELISARKTSPEHTNRDLTESPTVTLTWHASKLMNTIKVHKLPPKVHARIEALFSFRRLCLALNTSHTAKFPSLISHLTSVDVKQHVCLLLHSKILTHNKLCTHLEGKGCRTSSL